MRGASRAGAALALSTAAHAALLGGLLATVHPPPSPSPLVVRLVQVPLDALASRREGALDVDATAASVGAPPAAPSHHAAVRPRATEAASAEVLSAAPSPVARAGEAHLGPALPDAPLSATRGGAVGGAEAVAPGAGGAAGLAGGGAHLAELHRRLAEAAARCYPAAARRFRLTGTVPLHFCLDAAGAATGLTLEGSTGSPLLDRSALECVVPGAQPLSGFAGCFLVPVRFGS